MLTLPATIIDLLQPFEMLFHPRTWKKAQLMLIGAILAPGKRPVTSVLRVMGLGHEANFALYHHVLNRASWSSLKASHVLLTMLIGYLGTGTGPLVFGIEETIERCRGKRISAKGIYRDAVRSSKSHFVKANGLRWISLMCWLPSPVQSIIGHCLCLQRWHHRSDSTNSLERVPRSFPIGRVRALVSLPEPMIIQLRHWLPHRALVIVADSSYDVLELLHLCQSFSNPVTFITRLRLDAAL